MARSNQRQETNSSAAIGKGFDLGDQLFEAFELADNLIGFVEDQNHGSCLAQREVGIFYWKDSATDIVNSRREE